MRTIITFGWAIIALICSIPVHIYYRILAKKDQKKEWEKAHIYARRFFRQLMFLAGTEVDVRGAENIPKDTPILFVGNHRSYFDIIITHALSDRPLGYVAKKEFLKYPVLNYFITDIGCLYLDRTNPKEGLKTIKEGIEFMNQGLSLGLFPEGTRNHGDELLPFKEGGYKIAEKSKSPIVLMALSGFDEIFELNKGFNKIKKRKVVLEYSKPVYPHELPTPERKAYYASIPGQIEEMLKSHK